MEVQKTSLEGLLIIRTKCFRDERGWFTESFNLPRYESALGLDLHFVQDNISMSKKGILRGLHFQTLPFAQAKLITVIQGSVLDVAVDLRKNSSTYGQHFSIELSSDNMIQLFVPQGFAHGFITLEDDTLFQYKCDNIYSSEHEQTLLWNDKTLGIDWGLTTDPTTSRKDAMGMTFSSFDSPF